MKTLVLNWKMNGSSKLCKEFNNAFKNNENLIVACPSTLFSFFDKNIKIAAQCIHHEINGAYTGNISIDHILEFGVKYSIIGHSERRFYSKIEEQNIYKALFLCCSKEIIPILCIGENIGVKESKKTLSFLKNQIDNDIGRYIEFSSNSNKNLLNSKIIIAYEPIWSIGTGLIPENEYIMEILTYIRNYSNSIGLSNFEILYGGSVNESNIKKLSEIPNLNGFLVGSSGLSLDSVKFMLSALNNV